MKKIGILLSAALLLLLCAGCGTVPVAGESKAGESNEKSDTTEIIIEKQPRNVKGQFAESSEGYYYGCGSLVYFCPRGGSSFVPLCSKPNCKHNNRNCNAYVVDRWGIELYGDALYTKYDAIDPTDPGKYCDGEGFAKRNADGTDHAPVLLNLDTYQQRGSMTYTYSIYHGTAYVLILAQDDLSDQRDHLVAFNIDDGSSTELVEEYLREHRMKMLSIRDGKMYAMATKSRSFDDNSAERMNVVLDLTSGTVTEFPIYEYPVGDVTDTTVYYYDVDQDDYKAEHPGFKEYDRATGSIREIGMPVDEKSVGYPLYDTDYIYLCTEGEDETGGTLYILSRDYQVVDQLSLGRNQGILSVASDCIFLKDPAAEKDPIYEQDCSMLCLKKSQIGSHDLKPDKVEVIFPNVDWVELQPGEE